MPNNSFSFDDINPFMTPNTEKKEQEEQIIFPFFGNVKKEPEAPSFPPTFNQTSQVPNQTQPAASTLPPIFQQPAQQPVAQQPIFKAPEPTVSNPAPIFSQPEEKPDILDRYDPAKVKQVDEALAQMINDGRIDDIPKLKEAFNKLKLPYEAILSKKLSNTGDAALNSDGICDSANAILIGGPELSL